MLLARIATTTIDDMSPYAIPSFSYRVEWRAVSVGIGHSYLKRIMVNIALFGAEVRITTPGVASLQ